MQEELKNEKTLKDIQAMIESSYAHYNQVSDEE